MTPGLGSSWTSLAKTVASKVLPSSSLKRWEGLRNLLEQIQFGSGESLKEDLDRLVPLVKEILKDHRENREL